MTDSPAPNAEPAEPAAPPRTGATRGSRVAALLRPLWNTLTSMRTALLLLFLLALGAIPGALLPQRAVNEQKVREYLAARGTIGEVMDRLHLFDVFTSTWFVAIYVLLSVSLVGCLTPRMREYWQALRARPVRAPRNLARLPYHATFTCPGDRETVAGEVAALLRGWRSETRDEADGVIAISAERGFLREAGNLVFHFGLLVLLLAIAAGSLFHYEGQRIVIAGLKGDEAEQSVLANSVTANYDSFRMGALVDAAALTPFAVRVDDFQADYLSTGQAEMFTSRIRYQDGAALGSDVWQDYTLRVNDPLRIDGDRVYLQGHGYAPEFTVSFKDPRTGEWVPRTVRAPFLPEDGTTFLSSGVVRVDPPEGMYPDQRERRRHQVALQGLFAPTARWTGESGQLLSSRFPALHDPAVAIDVYEGDVGLDSGRAQNVYQLNTDFIANGLLTKIDRINLGKDEERVVRNAAGDEILKIRFNGAHQFVNLQTSRDPAQPWVLVSSVVMVAGLVVSLLIRRRRIWVRLTPVDGSGGAPRGTLVEMGGLARTDRAGWGEEFARLAAALESGESRRRPRPGRGSTEEDQ